MFSWKNTLLVFSFLLVLTGCNQSLSKNKAQIKPATIPVVASQVSDADGRFEGTLWQVTSVDGHQLPDYLKNTLEFGEEGVLRGFSGCNQFVAKYEKQGDSVSIRAVASTRKICFAAVMYQENRFISLLKSAERIELGGQQLKLYSERAETPIYLAPASFAVKN